MTFAVLTLFAPALTTTLLILTLILAKGEICPGQRGRIHRLLPALAVLWLAVASLKIEAFMVVFAIVYFYSRVSKEKTRDKGPFWLLHLANGLSLSFAAIIVVQQPSVSLSVFVAISGLLIGLAMSSLFLVVAKSRLQAFHRILPVVGVVVSMFCVVALAWNLSSWDDAFIESSLSLIVVSIVLLFVGIGFWCWPLIKHTPAKPLGTALGLLALIGATAPMLSLFWHQ
ncbi:hypothetical protein [Vibrio hippocampi]|uniref:Uncharacterized protein n=1 Tax=Vibrio hippocampi TaxID=654686 RepID=A0ABN8DG41_9VIBR|nr:hypothetical protein [Vibrio hippocampi]CAH0526409.1 hypothetical protein VHP8226_01791 [Vibrio hippocampi]